MKVIVGNWLFKNRFFSGLLFVLHIYKRSYLAYVQKSIFLFCGSFFVKDTAPYEKK